MRAALSFVIASTVCIALSSAAWAEKDKDKGRDKDHGRGASDHDRGQGQGQGRGDAVRVQPGPGRDAQVIIVDRDRSTVRTYYRTEYVAGNCPPGLAKKHNGCMPPGQAKKMWSVGQPLPPTIVYYPLPPILYGQLTPPPPGYNYVRIDDDIVMIVVSTRIIVGALGNLGQLED